MARKDPFFLGGVSSRYFLFSKLQSSFLFFISSHLYLYFSQFEKVKVFHGK